MDELEKAKLLSVATKLAKAEIEEARSQLLEQINSLQPKDGRDGRSIVDARIFEGQLVLQMNDGVLVTVGSVIGEQGPIGPVGQKGDKGDPGEAGPPGPRGDTGLTGPAGKDGERGPRGDQGPKGDTGAKGDQGERGEKGEQGIAGERGERGERGEQGPQGPAGTNGRDGRDGAKGEAGERGPQGVSGRNGRDGKDGKDGEVGPQGPKGDKGDKGDPGSDADVSKLEKKLEQFTQEVDRRVSKIAFNAATGGGPAGSGEVWLHKLDDVDYNIKYATDGQALVWNATLGKWQANTVSGGGGGISNTFTTTVATQTLIPTTNITYNLGSSTARYKDIWLANSTIYLGSAQISSSGNKVLLGGTAAVTNSYLTSTFIANTTTRSLINQKISVANAKSYMQVSNTKAYLANTNSFIKSQLANTNAFIKSQLANTNIHVGSKLSISTFNAALANTNAYIASIAGSGATWNALTSTNTALRTLINDRLQVSNAAAIYQTKTVERAALANTNSWIKAQLANTNLSIAEQSARVTLINTNLTGTNTSLRTIINDRLQVSNAAAIYATIATENARLANTNAFIKSQLANTNSYIATRASWSALTSTNTSIRNYVDTKVAAIVNSAPSTLDTLRELSAALANDANFSTTITNLIGTKISVANTKAYLANTNLFIKSQLANTNLYIATKLNTTTFNNALANTNSWIKSQLANTNSSIATQATRVTLVNTNLTGTNTALRTLISDRLQVANAVATYQTKAVERAALANTNAYIATKVNTTTFNLALANTNSYIATQASRINLINTNLTGTNTALRTIISDRLQVANASATYQTKSVERAALANTNSYIATQATRINLINTNLTGTNTALRTLISDRLQVANAASIYQTKAVERAALANTNSYIAAQATRITLVNTNLLNTNTAIRALDTAKLSVANAVAIYATKSNPTTSGLLAHTGRATISTNLTVSGNTTINGTTTDNSNALSQTLTDGVTISWDVSLGRVATVTLAGNRTMAAPTNLKVGTYILHVIQDATGNRSITWNAVFKWVGGVAPVLTTTAGRRDIFSFISDGTNLYGSFLPDVR